MDRRMKGGRAGVVFRRHKNGSNRPNPEEIKRDEGGQGFYILDGLWLQSSNA